MDERVHFASLLFANHNVRPGVCNGAAPSLCWIEGFKALRGKGTFACEAKALDRYRMQLLRRLRRELRRFPEGPVRQKAKLSQRARYLGHPFSYYAQLVRKETSSRPNEIETNQAKRLQFGTKMERPQTSTRPHRLPMHLNNENERS